MGAACGGGARTRPSARLSSSPPTSLAYRSTVGALLAERLGCPFYEGDDYHSAASVAKMRAGSALSDDDRWPWLARLAALLQGHLAAAIPAVLACSALTPAYRYLLRTGRRLEDRQQQQQQQQKQGIADHVGSGGGGGAVAFVSAPRSPFLHLTRSLTRTHARICNTGDAAEALQVYLSRCSQLRPLTAAVAAIAWPPQVLLDPPCEVLERRLRQRAGHFAPPALLDSQLRTLEWRDEELLLRVGGGGGGGGEPFPSPEATVDAVMALRQVAGR